jgi:hypothetical protein
MLVPWHGVQTRRHEFVESTYHRLLFIDDRARPAVVIPAGTQWRQSGTGFAGITTWNRNPGPGSEVRKLVVRGRLGFDRNFGFRVRPSVPDRVGGG